MISYDRAYLSRTEIAVFNDENQREGGEKPPRTRRRNGIARNGYFFPKNHCSLKEWEGRKERTPEAGKPSLSCSVTRANRVESLIAPSGKTTPSSHGFFRRRPRMPTTFLIALALLTSPFADSVVSYDAGIGGADGFTDPAAAIGEPTRFTGEGVWPSVVSQFNPPFMTNELVSIGVGGELVLSFDEPVFDNPANPYGIDLIIFGNTGFIDESWPKGVVDGMFSNDGGQLEVSADGITWVFVEGVETDNTWPTCGYQDSGTYDSVPGIDPTNFVLPIDPRLTLEDVSGVGYATLREYYNSSGGGVPVDLASTGLPSISFVRITVNVGSKLSPEIDGVSDVAPQMAGDVDMNGVVDVNDLLVAVANFGLMPLGGPLADFNGDFVIDVSDLLTIIGNWS